METTNKKSSNLIAESYQFLVDLAKEHNLRFVFVDVETTGQHWDVSYKRLGITEIAWTEVKSTGIGHRKSVLVNPEELISKGASDITNITNDMVKDKPTFHYFTNYLSQLFEGAIICGFNSNTYDWKVISLNFEHYNKEKTPTPFGFLDVRAVWMNISGQAKGKLTDIAKIYNVEYSDQAHRAFTDVDLTARVLVEFMKKHEEVVYPLINIAVTPKPLDMTKLSNKQLSDASIMQNYPKHGTPWGAEDKIALEKGIKEGHHLFTMASLLERKPSALYGRLKSQFIPLAETSYENQILTNLKKQLESLKPTSISIDPKDPYLFMKTMELTAYGYEFSLTENKYTLLEPATEEAIKRESETHYYEEALKSKNSLQLEVSPVLPIGEFYQSEEIKCDM